MTFEFATATRIIFGAGRVADLPGLMASLGHSALVLTGAHPLRHEAILGKMQGRGISIIRHVVTGEPTVDVVLEALKKARLAGSDLVVSIGGGAVIDTGKAVAALLTNKGEIYDHLEVVGQGLPLDHAPAPFIAVPTTAGAGAEVTRNAVITVPEKRVKVSLRSPMMLPKVALVDPALTLNLPPDLTAATGMDALSQLIEPFVSIKANPLTDGICREGMRLAAKHLAKAVAHGGDVEARSGMAAASLMGGLALANAGLGAVHGFAAPIGAMFPAPHGNVCAALLAPVMRANLQALRFGGLCTGKYDEIARILTGSVSAEADDGVAWIESLSRQFAFKGLSAFGLRLGEVADVVRRAQQASSMKANPVLLSTDQLGNVLLEAL